MNPSSAINAAISRPRDRRASFSPLHLLFLLRNVTPVPPIHSARDERDDARGNAAAAGPEAS